jgi:acyl carrier protein
LADTWERMQVVFRDLFDDDTLQLRPDMTAADVEAWDSLTHINLIVDIEREFKVRFTTGEITGLKTVGDLAALVDKKRSAAS